MFKLSPVSSLPPGLLKFHFIIIIILWTSDHAEQCKPISIHIILIQNPRAGLLDPPDPPWLHLFHCAAPIRATQNLELVREIIWLCTFDSIFLFSFCRVIPKWSQWTRRLEWLLLYLMLGLSQGEKPDIQTEIQSVQTVQPSRLGAKIKSFFE